MPDGKNYIIQNKSTKLTKILQNLGSIFKRKTYQINNHKDNNTVEELDQNQEVNNSVTHYEKLTAEDIMIPRIDIKAVDYNNSLDEITNAFIKTRHTRMPVYKNDLDNIVGFINIKDILLFVFNHKDNINFKIDDVLRKMLIIPPSMKISNLLEKMRQTRTHIALVIDELGGTDGLITIEDLIEEIIGDIEDEHDLEDDNIQFKKIDNKTFEVSGRIEIGALQDKLNINLSSDAIDEEYDTLGGLILSISSYVPNKGDKIIHPSSNIVFEIIDSDPRRIKTVRIHLQ